MIIETAPHGIHYDSPGICYFEVHNDGSVNRVTNDRSSIDRQGADSLYGAYFRALQGECKLYFTYADVSGNIFLYHADDLEALADSVGIERSSDHIHEIQWKYNKRDTGTGRYALIDIEFLCGCELGGLNKRIMAKQLKNQYGWDIVLKSIDSVQSSTKTIKVERNSIR